MEMSVIDPREVSNAFKGKTNCLFVFHFNPRSTNSKNDGLDVLFTELNITFDVVMFSETWEIEIAGVTRLRKVCKSLLVAAIYIMYIYDGSYAFQCIKSCQIVLPYDS